MRDLLVVVPSRGRPAQLRRLLQACARTCQAVTDIAVGVDDDDPALPEYSGLVAEDLHLPGTFLLITGARKNLTGWTNEIIERRSATQDYRFVASLGDDHLPRTPGWDVELMAAVGRLGGTGFAYGDDLAQGENLPTAVVASTDIIGVLGWLCEPSMGHYCVDNVWKTLGELAGCLAYVPQVVIEHLHPAVRKADPDGTYADAGHWSLTHPDQLAYQEWLAWRAPADAAKIRALTDRG